MKLSLKWLCEHIDASEFFDESEVLSDKLTDAGLEVEEISIGGKDFDHVVVGEIVQLGKHPDADKLTYCDVNVGLKENLKIVCGAKNHKQGDKVVVAQVGAVLPGNFKIKKSKIRGVESFGMLCSEKELGLSEESEGIMILRPNIPVGTNFAQYANLDDVFFEINVTPNRADCLSHLGLAREVSTLFDKTLYETKKLEVSKTEKDRDFKLTLKDSENCPRYMGRAVYGVEVKPSPEWLQKRLEAVGIKSINNIVDITNFIMLDMGQPLHAFDFDRLESKELLIAPSEKGETFVTLDGTELKLTGEELSIRTPQGPVALAGVIGGKNSGVDDNTKNIFLEAAHFIPSSVRKTSRRLGIETDSCYRFSRGTDESQVHLCLDKALAMILDLAGGTLGETTFEEYPIQKKDSQIKVAKEYLIGRLGFEVSHDQIEKVFKDLNFKILKSNGSEWTVVPPSYRWDIEIKEDLVEEIGRLVGYSQIPEVLPELSSVPQQDVGEYTFFKKIKSHMVQLGFSEAVHYNFYSSKQEAGQGEEILNWSGSQTFPSGKMVSIENPLSEDLSVMRTSLVPQLFSNYVRNFKMGNSKGQAFELGTCHVQGESGFYETPLLCLGIWDGNKNTSTQDLLTQLMGQLQSFMSFWKVGQWKAESVKTESMPSLFHPSLTASLKAEGKELGFISTLHPAYSDRLKVSSQFVYAEINLEKFLKGKPRPIKYKDFSRFPIVDRDFSVTVDKTYSMDELSKRIKKASGALFSGISLKDQYMGQGVPEGKVSVTLNVKFQAADHTLNEEELKKTQEKVLDSLAGL